jgi:hypothetical protein
MPNFEIGDLVRLKFGDPTTAPANVGSVRVF